MCKDVLIPQDDAEGLDDLLKLKVATVTGRRRKTRGAKKKSRGRSLRPLRGFRPIRGVDLAMGLQIWSSQSPLVHFLQEFLQGNQEVRGKR